MSVENIELTIIAKVGKEQMVETKYLPGGTFKECGIDINPSHPVTVEFFFDGPRDRMSVEWMNERKELKTADCESETVLGSIIGNSNAHLAILAFIDTQGEVSPTVH